MKTVIILPGKLGISVQFYTNSYRGGAVITAIHPTCTFRDEVEIGDQLMSIDGKPIFSVKDIQDGNERVRKLGIIPGGEAAQQDNSAKTNKSESSTDDDADAPPKQPIGIRKAYDFFQYEMRVKLAEVALDDGPRISLAKRWRTLTKAQKKPYEKMVARDKVRYHREMAEYLSQMNKHSQSSDDDDELGINDDNPYVRTYITTPSASGGRVRTKVASTHINNDNGESDESSASTESDGSDPDWQSNRKRKRKKSEVDENDQQQEKPYKIERCMSMHKLDQSATYLEDLIRTKTDEATSLQDLIRTKTDEATSLQELICTKTDELQLVKRRQEYLKSIESIPRIECSHEGCTNKAQGGGLCTKHGGTQITRTIQCSVQGCTNRTRTIECGLCYKHGCVPKKRCNFEGCNSNRKAGAFCLRHAITKPKHYYCKVEGCMKKSQRGGLCARHGAPIPRCSMEGCTSYAKKGGLCARHAVESSPLSEA